MGLLRLTSLAGLTVLLAVFAVAVPSCSSPQVSRSPTPTAAASVFTSPSPTASAVVFPTPAKPLPNSAFDPGGHLGTITADRAGDLWFASSDRDEVCRLNIDVTPTCVSTGNLKPHAIAVAADGSLWMTLSSPAQIGRLANGMLTRFLVPNGGQPFQVVGGPDGKMWFSDWPICTATSACDGRIGAIDSTGQVMEYDTPGARPQSIVIGTDGTLWFSTTGAQIGRISAAGNVSYLDTQISGDYLALGADGNVYLSQGGQRQPVLGHITPAGVVTLFPYPQGHVGMLGAGPDGAMWFFSYNPGHLGRITTNGTITETPLPWPVANAVLVTAAPGGIWLSDGQTIWWFVPSGGN